MLVEAMSARQRASVLLDMPIDLRRPLWAILAPREKAAAMNTMNWGV